MLCFVYNIIIIDEMLWWLMDYNSLSTSRIKYVSLTCTQHTCPSNTTWNHHCEHMSIYAYTVQMYSGFKRLELTIVFNIWISCTSFKIQTLLRHKITPRSLSDDARSWRGVRSFFFCNLLVFHYLIHFHHFPHTTD